MMGKACQLTVSPQSAQGYFTKALHIIESYGYREAMANLYELGECVLKLFHLVNVGFLSPLLV